jgi:hypothetical protein
MAKQGKEKKTSGLENEVLVILQAVGGKEEVSSL